MPVRRSIIACLLPLALWAACWTAAAGADQARETAPALQAPAPHLVSSRKGPLKDAITRLVAFETAPFPYTGTMPRSGQPFLDVTYEGRKGHSTGYGRVYWQDETYNDRRVLLHLPKGFDIRKPCLMVVFYHGHGATLERDVYVRQQVAQQLSASGLNAVLVAPQLAVDAADSSAGKLWQPGAFGAFTGEAAQKLAQLLGDKKSVRTFATMPVVIIAYSGGFMPAAWSADRGGLKQRVKGIVLMDALYGETKKFVNWITQNRKGFFVTTYLGSTREHNFELQRLLTEKKIPLRFDLEKKMKPGSAVFLDGGPDSNHRDLMTNAWAPNPVQDLLGRIKAYAR